MTRLTPLDTLYDASAGPEIALDGELARLYGALRFPAPDGRPWVIGNFVSTMDGVTVLDDPLLHGGGEISGYNAHDRMVMGVLRAVAASIVVGAGTLRAESNHIWTAEYIYRDLAAEFAALRRRLGLSPAPLNVFVTARGEIDLQLPVFTKGQAPSLIVTTRAGEQRLRTQAVPASVTIVAAPDVQRVSAAAIMDAIARVQPSRVVLVEGGPRLMTDFFAERKLDEMFLTIAPQVAGRAAGVDRPGFVEGGLFAPNNARWSKLVSVKRAGSHLLLRYDFSAEHAAAPAR